MSTAQQFIADLIKQAGVVDTDAVGSGLKAYSGPLARQINAFGERIAPSVSSRPDASITEKFTNRAYFPASGGNAGSLPFGRATIMNNDPQLGTPEIMKLQKQTPVFHPGPWNGRVPPQHDQTPGDLIYDLNPGTHQIPLRQVQR